MNGNIVLVEQLFQNFFRRIKEAKEYQEKAISLRDGLRRMGIETETKKNESV